MNPIRASLLAAVLACSLPAAAAPVLSMLPGSAAPQPLAPQPAAVASGSAAALLADGRYGHSAAALPDGRVLIAGGNDGSEILASAEIYDPLTGTFAATGPMVNRRMYDDAGTVVLADGRVLVTGGCVNLGGSWGGYTVCQGVPHSEIYDPVLGRFAPTADLAGPRNLHNAVRLADGRVLVVGGTDSNPEAPQWVLAAERYDPVTGRFETTGSLATGRSYAAAVALADGRALVLGGQTTSATPLAQAELYDPATGRFAPAGDMTAARIAPTATRLPDGRVLVYGGFNRDATPVAHAEVYDPADGTFTAIAAAPSAPRYYHTATTLPDGRIVFAGGNGSAMSPIAPVELYDPVQGGFQVVAALTHPVTFHTATLTGDADVLVAGGLDPGVVTRPEGQRIVLPRADGVFGDGFEP